MSEPQIQSEVTRDLHISDTKLHASMGRRLSFEQTEILKGFSKDEQRDIKYKQRVLSSLTYFIGKDFTIPIELNTPGAGWHWDFKENKVRVDPKDLVEKPLDYLRFVFSHEGSHRRISRVENVALETWKQPGYSFMVNALEDPRVNNFLIETYPRIRGQVQVAYDMQNEIETQFKAETKGNTGFQPRCIQAGFEYIKLWYKEIQNQPMELSEDLAPEVVEVIKKTLEAAQDVWWRYPSRQEADSGEEQIKAYVEATQKIMQEKIWPEFKKLVDMDLEDAKTQEALGEIMESGQGKDLPKELKDKLNNKETKELEDAIKEATKDGGPSPIDLDSLSKELKDKIKDYVDSLPTPTKEEIEEAAREMMKEIGDIVNELLEGKLSQNHEERKDKGEDKPERSLFGESSATQDEKKNPEKKNQTVREYEESDEFQRFKEKFGKTMEREENIYESEREKVLPIIDALEQDLREIFIARRESIWRSGYKSGKRIDIKKRMQEKALDISPIESRAWQKRKLPQEKDYAITLLVDLSGSMQGDTIAETFKGVIVLAEVLNRLSISTEILGFNCVIHEYQTFGQDMSNEIRSKMGGMLEEVNDLRAGWNDDGWAVEEASKRLARQKASEKYLFALSDGIPLPSTLHDGPEYELAYVIKKILSNTDQKVIGLGLGPGTEHVKAYYPRSVDSIKVQELPEKLADLIRDAISNPGTSGL